MNLSLKIFTAFGIPVRLHVSMLIVPWLAIGWSGDGGLLGAIIITVILFGSVLLHELGHSLVARRFGVQTVDIVLTPIGGMARIVNMTTRPKAEIAIAIAGPLVSLALAGTMFFLLPVMIFVPFSPLLEGVGTAMFINLGLGLFNLVPALPMDGGRVLRGILATKKTYLEATILAARVSRTLAVAGGAYAIISDRSFSLVLIALFIFFSAGTEVRMAMAREARAQGNAPFGARGFPFGFRGGPGDPGSPPPGPREETVAQPPFSPGARPFRHKPGPVIIEGGKAKIVAKRDPSN